MHDVLLSAAETIYECVGDTFDRERALKTYSQLTDDSGVILTDLDLQLGEAKSLSWYNLDEGTTKTFADRGRCPIRVELIRAMLSAPLCTTVERAALVSGDRWQRSELYREGSMPWGMHSEIGNPIAQTEHTRTFFFTERHKNQEPLDAEMLRVASFLNHHLNRAMNLQIRIDTLEEALIQSNNVLDLIEFGLVLYDANQTPTFVNAAARRILKEEDGIRLRPGKLEVSNRIANQQLQTLLGTIYSLDPANGDYAGGIIPVPRPSYLRPYSLMAVPMRPKDLNLTGVSAAVFIFDPGAKKTTAIQMFVSSYDLTRSEAELAHSLALGNSLDEAAAKRGVSRNTAKSQLHSIFSKTDTSRQSELVSLVLRSIAGISLKS